MVIGKNTICKVEIINQTIKNYRRDRPGKTALFKFLSISLSHNQSY